MKHKFLFSFILISTNLLSQNTRSEIVYKISPIHFEMPQQADAETKASFEKIIEFAENQTFTLEFNSHQSKFTLNEFISPQMSDEDTKFYNNMACFRFTSEWSEYHLDKSNNEEYFKQFDGTIIKNKAEPINWEISTESKTISNYKTYKAIYNMPFTARDGKTKIRKITAWFAPELPYSYGPKQFHGLPGLILELQEKETVYYVSKLNLDSKNTVEISFPKGKTITMDEFINGISK